MFNKIKKIFSKSIESVERIAKEKEIKEEDIADVLWDMQLNLIQNNVALEVTENITNRIKKAIIGRKTKKKIKEEIIEALKQYLDEIFQEKSIEEIIKEQENKQRPYLILFFGINGAGKTTTIAKMAKHLKDKGKSVILAAGDTFRAAAIEQLEIHGKNLGIKVIKHKYGSDSAAVIYDALEHAKAKGIDFVLADTAGRIHTNKNLIEELKKIVRVNKPDLKIFVGESIAGNDLLEQINSFKEVGIDAIILTKFDVDDKKGSLISISSLTKKPIIFLGVGQEYKDIKEFNKKDVIKEIMEGI